MNKGLVSRIHNYYNSIKRQKLSLKISKRFVQTFHPKKLKKNIYMANKSIKKMPMKIAVRCTLHAH